MKAARLHHSAAAPPSPPPSAPPAPAAMNLFGGGALVLMLVLVAAALAGIGLIVWQMTVHHNHLYDIMWVVAGGVMMLTVPLTVLQVRGQLQRVVEPQLQLLAVRIAWLPLVLAIDAWFALKLHGVQVYSALFCGWYQAWAVYSLYTYLTVCISTSAAKAEAAAAPSGRSSVLCRLFALQYSAVQFCVSSAAFATTFVHKYGDGAMRHDRAYFPLTIALNVSQAMAIGALAALATACGRVPQAAPRRAGSKVAWLSLVIFATYWQEMIIYALLRFSAVKTSASWTLQSTSRSDVAHGMHAWILCIEMAAAAAAFGATFAPIQSGGDAEVGQGVGFLTGLACAFGIAAPPQTAEPYDAEACVSAAEVEADAEAVARAERRRRREKRSTVPSDSAEPSGASFSDSARPDAAPPTAAAEAMLQPPRERRRKPLPYALSAMPVVLAPPEPEALQAENAPALGVYSGILGWMGMGQPSHPYADEVPPVPLPAPGMPLRVPIAVAHDAEAGAVSGGPGLGAQQQEPAKLPQPQPTVPPLPLVVPPASESLTELIAKMTLQVQGTIKPS